MLFNTLSWARFLDGLPIKNGWDFVLTIPNGCGLWHWDYHIRQVKLVISMVWWLVNNLIAQEVMQAVRLSIWDIPSPRWIIGIRILTSNDFGSGLVPKIKLCGKLEALWGLDLSVWCFHRFRELVGWLHRPIKQYWAMLIFLRCQSFKMATFSENWLPQNLMAHHGSSENSNLRGIRTIFQTHPDVLPLTWHWFQAL